MLQNNTRGEELMKVFETIVHGNEQDLMQENEIGRASCRERV